MEKNKLDRAELNFLNNYNVPMENVFDATGLDKHRCKEIMGRNSYQISWGRYACRNNGHKLRTRSDHCVQCNPNYLMYQNRYADTKFIYIAESSSNKVIKVGTTIGPSQREISLNDQNYGGFNDWSMTYFIRVNNSGDIETKLHNALSKYKFIGYYIKDDSWQEAREMFKVNSSVAKLLLDKFSNQNLDKSLKVRESK
jgi:hypothetical protein